MANTPFVPNIISGSDGTSFFRAPGDTGTGTKLSGSSDVSGILSELNKTGVASSAFPGLLKDLSSSAGEAQTSADAAQKAADARNAALRGDIQTSFDSQVALQRKQGQAEVGQAESQLGAERGFGASSSRIQFLHSLNEQTDSYINDLEKQRRSALTTLDANAASEAASRIQQLRDKQFEIRKTVLDEALSTLSTVQGANKPISVSGRTYQPQPDGTYKDTGSTSKAIKVGNALYAQDDNGNYQLVGGTAPSTLQEQTDSKIAIARATAAAKATPKPVSQYVDENGVKVTVYGVPDPANPGKYFATSKEVNGKTQPIDNTAASFTPSASQTPQITPTDTGSSFNSSDASPPPTNQRIANTPIPSLGVSPNALWQAAITYATQGGAITSFVGGAGGSSKTKLGRESAAFKQGVINKASALATSAGTTLTEIQQSYKGASSALKDQIGQLNSIDVSLKTAETNGDQVLNLFAGKGINENDSAYANEKLNDLSKSLGKSGDIRAYQAGLQEVGNDYANVFNRSGTATVDSNKRAQDIISGNITLKDLKESLDTLKTLGQGVVQTRMNQVNNLDTDGTLSRFYATVYGIQPSGDTSGSNVDFSQFYK